MESNLENALATASSAYLRSARHQPVRWHEWGTEAFEKARSENKPVLLDIGAVWCHWCHVMDRESYEDPELASFINERFVAVKVDRDERPDVDTRYQSAISTISGQGGWPLTAFLTPEGKPYFGGTYFPPEERYGRPSFRRVLTTMADVFQNKRDEVEESAGSVLAAIEHNETFVGGEAELNDALLENLITAIVAQFDPRNGGFGSQPKFPHSGALDLLIDASSRSGPSAAKAEEIVTTTLRKMANGGVYDQLAGGFHRYSVDEHWTVPHFEKMAYDNSELLRNYVHAFQSYLQPEFARTARDIIRWMNELLSDQERGGFYASQDADFSLQDDGDYFTWTRAEAKAVLSQEEFEIAAIYFNLRDVGDMHHNPQKNVLHVRSTFAEIALRTSSSAEAVEHLIASAKAKMYASRQTRPVPYVDTTIYTSWNGMCISAYLEAGRVLGLPETVAFALKSLERVLSSAWSEAHKLAHVVAYGETGGISKHVAGGLDDYAAIANAALDAWETTGELRYFETAESMARAMISSFYDEESGGFFDAERADEGSALAVLSVRRKPVQDSPTPAGNATATTVLLRLAAITNNPDFSQRAERTLKTFASVVEHYGLYAGTYGLALRRFLTQPVQVSVVGEDALADKLFAAATVGYEVNKSVVRLAQHQFVALPAALAATLPHLPRQEGSFAAVCQGLACLPPIATPDHLAKVLSPDATS